MPDDITHNISARRFEMNVHGQLALVDYRLRPGVIVYSHAEVPREHWGRGHGAKLAKHVLDYARDEGLKVVPACPFIATYMRRHPEYETLRALPD